jgi:hypothetical protein
VQATTVTLSGWSAGETGDDLLRPVVDTFNATTHPFLKTLPTRGRV